MSNRILSYRGLLADGGQETLLLSTNKGEKGYRITKFQIMPDDPNQSTVKHVVKIYSLFQSAIDDSVDFSDNRLLGAATYNEAPGPQDQAGYQTIIFDQTIFNQDIYVTNSEPSNNQPVNYLIELEVIKLDESQAMVATLKDIRNNS